MTFQVFGTGHLGPEYRPRPLTELPKLQPGAADFLARFAVDAGYPLCPWQVKLIQSLEVEPEATPTGETCQPRQPVVPVSSQLVDDARKHPRAAETRAHIAASLRKAWDTPLPPADWWRQ